VLGRNPPLSVLRALSFREPQPAGSARYSNHSPNGQYRRNIIITIWVNQDHLAEEREREREREIHSLRAIFPIDLVSPPVAKFSLVDRLQS